MKLKYNKLGISIPEEKNETDLLLDSIPSNEENISLIWDSKCDRINEKIYKLSLPDYFAKRTSMSTNPKIERIDLFKTKFINEVFIGKSALFDQGIDELFFKHKDKVIISEQALKNCNNLNKISFFECKKIFLGEQSFFHSELKYFQMSRAAIYGKIPQNCFSHCDELNQIELFIQPDEKGNIIIDEEAFSSCGKLKNFKINVVEANSNICNIYFNPKSFATQGAVPVDRTIDIVLEDSTKITQLVIKVSSQTFTTGDGSQKFPKITFSVTSKNEKDIIFLLENNTGFSMESEILSNSFQDIIKKSELPNVKTQDILLDDNKVEKYKVINSRFFIKCDISEDPITPSPDFDKEIEKSKSIIYVIYGLSGPMKEWLHLFASQYYFTYPDENEYQIENIKFTNRDINEYDKEKIIELQSRSKVIFKNDQYLREINQEITPQMDNSINVGYTITASDYLDLDSELAKQIYEHNWKLNDTQIVNSLSRNKDHFLIWNDIKSLNSLIDRFKELKYEYHIIDVHIDPSLDIKNILTKFESSKTDNVDIRVARIKFLNTQPFNREIESKNYTRITMNTSFTYSMFKENLLSIINENSPRFDWRRLLLDERYGDFFNFEESDDATVIDVKSTKQANYNSFFVDDYDIISSLASFRRLQDKCQVFLLKRRDYPRTRLTHSIEVATTAEIIGEQVVSFLRGDRAENEALNEINERHRDYFKICRSIPIILRNASLLHDMGNPPFGHFGEEYISEWFKKEATIQKIKDIISLIDEGLIEKKSIESVTDGLISQDFKHFEGNAQMFRLSTSLTKYNKKDCYPNLTLATISSAIKYLYSAGEIYNEKEERVLDNLLSHKNGFFESEKQEFEKIIQELGLQKGDVRHRHPLAYLLEASDDISYLSHDIEDALKRGLINIDDILEEITLIFSENTFSLPCNDKIYDFQTYVELLKNNIYSNEIDKDFAYKQIRNKIKEMMIDSVVKAFVNNYETIMSRDVFLNDALIELSTSKNIDKVIRRLLVKYVYHSRELVDDELKAAEIMNVLLEKYVLSSIKYGIYALNNYFKTKNSYFYSSKMFEGLDTDSYNIWLSISNNYRNSWLDQDNQMNRMICNSLTLDNKKKYLKSKISNCIQLALDHFCGMTDSYAMEMYKIFKAI